MYKLILTIEGYDDVTINLRPSEQDMLEMGDFSMQNVYSDGEYKITLVPDETETRTILKVRLYVNEDPLSAFYYGDKIV